MGPHALAELIPAWPRQTHLELGAFPSAVPCARAHVRAVATECGLAHLPLCQTPVRHEDEVNLCGQ